MGSFFKGLINETLEMVMFFIDNTCSLTFDTTLILPLVLGYSCGLWNHQLPLIILSIMISNYLISLKLVHLLSKPTFLGWT